MGRTLVRTFGEVLITLGVVVGLFVVYELWVTGIFAAHTQARLHRELAQQWATPVPPVGRSDPPAPLSLGSGIAILRIPIFGAGYDPVIVQGVDTADLERGPGHYPGTAMPGGLGNFVVSGHRTTWGHWFYEINILTPGDVIGVETRAHWYIYRVTGQQVVSPFDLAVIDPVPNHPGVRPTQHLLTLTTCTPTFSAAQRLVVYAALAETLPRTRALPAVLTAGRA